MNRLASAVLVLIWILGATVFFTLALYANDPIVRAAMLFFGCVDVVNAAREDRERTI